MSNFTIGSEILKDDRIKTKVAILSVFLLLTGRKSRHDGIPFGPFLAVGGYVGYLAGRQLWQLYWGLP